MTSAHLVLVVLVSGLAAAYSLVLAGYRLVLRDAIARPSVYDVAAGLWFEPGWRARALERIDTAPGTSRWC